MSDDDDKTEIFSLQNIYQNLNLDYYLPHQSLFLDDKIDVEDRENYNSIYSTLYLLSNSKFLMEHFLNLNEDKLNDKLKIFFHMIRLAYDTIKDLKDSQNDMTNSKDKNSDKKNYYELINVTIKKFIKNKKIDPRHLIADILFKTMRNSKNYSNSNTLINNSNGSKQIQIGSEESYSFEIFYDLIPDDFANSSSFSLSNNVDKSYENIYSLIDESQISDIEKNSKDIILKAEVNNEKKFIPINFIIFNLSEEGDKIYKFEDCFQNFLEKIDQKRYPFIKKKFFYKLPETLIILLFFGKNKETPENCKYAFKEVIDFSKSEYANLIDGDVKSKKYRLSGLMACKFPKIEHKRFFYTFSRKNKNDNDNGYYLYNTKEKEIHEENDVNDKLQKNNKVNEKGSTSYPYVLIYNEIEK